MSLGELVGFGRSADVFAIDDRWVLRRYRDGGDATAEALVMRHVAEYGYPVPGVRSSEGNQGPEAQVVSHATRGELVLQRLSGPTLRKAMRQAAVSADQTGAMLADLLHRLHTIPARVSADPEHRVLHLDLHPDNVMLTPSGPMVIDWRNTEEGHPALDWAMTALILAQVAVGPTAEATHGRAVLVSLLQRHDPLIHLGGAHADCLAKARTRRAADPNMDALEVRVLDDAAALVRELETELRE
ncbi:phosphotransferase [Streptomyces sp. NBC_00690]|uniref:phosphotransferase n=1 Tax=Streptomyces sp. NBC_00690 TaxID=2975808 RepID=UPI002E293191|nr:phosphotransferase [Streptomyces sp. NBC_00690]